MTPEQTAQAAIDLKAKIVLPVHWAKFSLALHDWDEPIRRLTAEAAKRELKLATPLIGQPVVLDDFYPNKPWWEEVK
jgi:L-ascorbate metabolism protein UlaG (beta-lactamase superfamily)